LKKLLIPAIAFLSISVLISFGLASNQAFAGLPGGGGGGLIPPGTTCVDCELDFQECEEGGMTGYDECAAIRDSCRRALMCTAVGGEFIGIETTSVLVAGTQTTAAWMIPIIVAAAGFGLLIQTQKTKLKHNSCPSCKLESDDIFELGDKTVGNCDNPKCRVSLFYKK